MQLVHKRLRKESSAARKLYSLAPPGAGKKTHLAIAAATQGCIKTKFISAADVMVATRGRQAHRFTFKPFF
ncbi:protein of unknown function (plasmid) [Cupriavidus taiwanensis]|uniref:Uncharacterized protein n=1 Tax=Cupriavidus taiwanensis TaxID=164546 RepID=A0A375IRE9_9BURK|nr:protein of unknown function [Cupriavidus taiwanensis]